MLQNEAFTLRVPPGLYIELTLQLRKHHDSRQLVDVLPLALKAWLASYLGNPANRGYQWKDLFLPHGTELRTRYRGAYYYANVEGDQLRYAGASVSPRGWVASLTGSVRNAWRDVWIRECPNGCWIQASAMRAKNAMLSAPPGQGRRHRERRETARASGS